ncbi:hypothetical protein GGF31_005921 [Allomyces arbusculus]|nr:hypothetical protein GGF31_005921 [Allomyces arbusculus]
MSATVARTIAVAPLVDAPTQALHTANALVLDADSCAMKATSTSTILPGDQVGKHAVPALVTDIGGRIETTVSCDTLLAHLVLLAVFHRQLRDDENEVKDIAFLCAAETRYLAFMDALAKAVMNDVSLVDAPPLPPVDVALFWHAHMLSPIRYMDDVQRRYGRALARVSFPLQRMAKALMGKHHADKDTARAFWVAHLPAEMPFDLNLADVNENAVTTMVVCPSCINEQLLSMPEYVALRKHAQAHVCSNCNAAFTAEHVAVHRLLTIIACAPKYARIAGTQTHPKTLVFRPDVTATATDLALLLDKSTWTKHVAKLPTLSTWTDVESTVFAPIMAAHADKLQLPGNKSRFRIMANAHRDVTTGPWSMDLVRAVLRQRRFSAKMTDTVVGAGHAAVHRAVAEALAQYPKFLALMVVRPGTPLVPTQFIDLAWHTHQLHASAYARDTVALTGKVANHDDSDGDSAKARLVAGAERTAEAWAEVFGEDYLRPKVSSIVNAVAQCDECHTRRDLAADTSADAAAALTNCSDKCRCGGCVFCDVAVLANYAAACRCGGCVFCDAAVSAMGAAACRCGGCVFCDAAVSATGAAECRVE